VGGEAGTQDCSVQHDPASVQHAGRGRAAARIRDVGPASTIMATDFGQPDSPAPADGLESYIQGMLTHGFSADEVRRMVSVHARSLLVLLRAV